MIEEQNAIIDVPNLQGDVTGNRINLDTRTIMFYSYIDEIMAKEVGTTLAFMDKVRDEPIILKINSMGGHVGDAQTIITELLSCKNEIHINITGYAFSGAAMIALTGDKTKMSQYGLYMLHYPNWETDTASLKQHKLDVKVTTEHFERIMKGLLVDTGIPIDEFRKQAKDDWYMTPKMCLKRGIIDEIY